MRSFKRGVFSLVVLLVALQIVSASASPPAEKKANAPNELTQMVSQYQATANDLLAQDDLVVSNQSNQVVAYSKNVPDTGKPVFGMKKLHPIIWADVRIRTHKPVYNEQRLPKILMLTSFDVRPQKGQGLILTL